MRRVSMSWPYWIAFGVSALAFLGTGLWGWAYAAGAVLAFGCLMRGALVGVAYGLGWIAVCYIATGGTLEFIPPEMQQNATTVLGALVFLGVTIFGLLYIFVGDRAKSAHRAMGDMRSRKEKRPREE